MEIRVEERRNKWEMTVRPDGEMDEEGIVMWMNRGKVEQGGG